MFCKFQKCNFGSGDRNISKINSSSSPETRFEELRWRELRQQKPRDGGGRMSGGQWMAFNGLAYDLKTVTGGGGRIMFV